MNFSETRFLKKRKSALPMTRNYKEKIIPIKYLEEKMQKVISIFVATSLLILFCANYTMAFSIHKKIDLSHVEGDLQGKRIEGWTIDRNDNNKIQILDSKYNKDEATVYISLTAIDLNSESGISGKLRLSYEYAADDWNLLESKPIKVSRLERSEVKRIKKEILNPFISDQVLGWFDEVKTNVGDSYVYCGMGGKSLKYRYDTKIELQSFIPKSIINNISFDEINNYFCLCAGVTDKDKRFYMLLVKDAWYKTTINEVSGWVYSKDLKADYYGFRDNYEKKWATFVKESIDGYEKPNGSKNGSSFRGGKREIYETTEGWVNINEPIRVGYWVPKSKVIKIEMEEAIPWYGVVTSSTAYIYSEPNKNSKKIAKKKKGEQVLLLKVAIVGDKFTGYKEINYKTVEAICNP